MELEANALFNCDALTFLERLPSDRVALIYLDPPWNTQSNFGRGGENIDALFSDEYFAYLSKVFQQTHRILSANGSLFVHWSLKAKMDIRFVMNQIFAPRPRYEITWYPRGGRHSNIKGPKIDNEFILVYSKSDEFVYNPLLRPLSSDEASRYSRMDGRGAYIASDLTMPFGRPALQFVWRGYELPSNRSWKFPLGKLEELASQNQIQFPSTTGLPRLKRYLDESGGIEIGMIWDDISILPTSGEGTRIPGQKPMAMMERIIRLASNEGDLVVDPFCGSGTTLVCAQLLGRRWWGGDNSTEAQQITQERLNTQCGLKAGENYTVYDDTGITAFPPMEITYHEIVENVEQIRQLQHQVSTLTDHLLVLKRLMNIGEGDDDKRVDAAIEEMAYWISLSIANQRQSVESYVPVVQAWLPGWDFLEPASQVFLPEAELLFEIAVQSNAQDYSPFIIQYCKALENELLSKLFTAYTHDLHTRFPDVEEFVAEDLRDDKTKTFARGLRNRKLTYTLGEMVFIMKLLKQGGHTLLQSVLLQDFRSFVVHYFNENTVEESYLNQISVINEDFRRKSAHPYLLDIQVAERCRDLLRNCLNELILNYQGSKDRDE